jgi:thiamine-phosphate pyrophosphorylase
MKCDKQMMTLYGVTDRAWVGEQNLFQQVEAALRGGVTCIQLREKALGREEFLKEAKEIAVLCRRYGVPFIVNDDVEIALASQADGVHLGQKDGNVAQIRKKVGQQLIIGVSAHSVEEAGQAVADGADYLGVGAVFGTSTKPDARLLSRETLLEICRTVQIPVVAIGGIHRENILELSGTGVDGVALVSAIFGAEDIEAECRQLRKRSEQMTAGHSNT